MCRAVMVRSVDDRRVWAFCNRKTLWTVSCRSHMEDRGFQIITSVSLSCFAKERCIPWNINFRLLDLSHKYVITWQWFRMKVCYSTPAWTQCHNCGGILYHSFPPVGWWRWTNDACYAYSRAPVTQPESRDLLRGSSEPLVGFLMSVRKYRRLRNLTDINLNTYIIRNSCNEILLPV
jgi:hypothetical protein